ncbi:hypothetical protein AGDE_03755 [Angomonas deanei]|uniref:Transmembrane protein n=1 Tax=Angomonas deanei TaxID=59799 RepID=A0A7G2C1H1_9TRYP|nr:hypothetical protein AGDE_03755 [Angomonas deanei]CAD2213375.1 hypothetical protein, conserved [Angomonas deanei]|eukprot:EPY40173.1 hypothetical protein AGDE_03755 [Angomonas deanei]
MCNITNCILPPFFFSSRLTTAVTKGIVAMAGYKQPPVMRRSRSWRGVMQVRFDDTRSDRNKIGRQAFFWAPIRVFGSGLALVALVYFYCGHDTFLHTLLGYESEMQYEVRVNPTAAPYKTPGAGTNKGWKSPLRDLEQPLHPKPEFDVFRDPKSTLIFFCFSCG